MSQTPRPTDAPDEDARRQAHVVPIRSLRGGVGKTTADVDLGHLAAVVGARLFLTTDPDTQSAASTGGEGDELDPPPVGSA